MHLDGFGEADRFAHQSLDAGPQRQMLALDLLRVTLARVMHFRLEVMSIRTPMIRIIACDSKGI